MKKTAKAPPASPMPERRRAVVIDGLRRQAQALARAPDDDRLFERLVERFEDRDVEKTRAIFQQRPPLALVRFDTPGIQNYLFRVSRPVDVEGGSRLVEDFVADAPDDEADELSVRGILGRRHGIQEEAFIYCGGGGGLVITSGADAPAVMETLEGILARETDGELRTVAAWVGIWPWELAGARIDSRSSSVGRPVQDALARVLGPLRETSPYAEALACLELRIQKRRAERTLPPVGLSGARVHQRCEACVCREGRPRGQELGRAVCLCDGCERRRERGRRAKRGFDQIQSYEGLVEGLGDPGLAVIYADGANIGELFQRVRNTEQHEKLSRAVSRAMSRAKEQAIEVALGVSGGEENSWLKKPMPDGTLFRHQSPLVGGDDLVLILPACLASEVILPLIETFEGAFGDPELSAAFTEDPEWSTRLETLGVGVGCVIADWMFPIKFSLDYAKALLSSAKGRIRKMGRGSAVDFMVLKNAVPLSTRVSELRGKHLVRSLDGGPAEPGSPDVLQLTRRPYSAEEFRALLEKAKALTRVPASQRHLIREQLFKGQRLSRNLWRYQNARSEVWAELRERLKVDLTDIDDLLWQKTGAGGGYSTDFLDALDWVQQMESLASIHQRFNRGAA